MKRVLSLVLVLIMVFVLVGCGISATTKNVKPEKDNSEEIAKLVDIVNTLVDENKKLQARIDELEAEKVEKQIVSEVPNEEPKPQPQEQPKEPPKEESKEPVQEEDEIDENEIAIMNEIIEKAKKVYNAAQICATEASALGFANADIEMAINIYLIGEDAENILYDGLRASCAKVINLIGKDVMSDNPHMRIILSSTEKGEVTDVYYDSDGQDIDGAGGYIVWINVESGVILIERGDQLNQICWPE